MSYNKSDLQRRMDSSYENFAKELGGLRAGRASTAMLEPIVVDVYGSKMPIPRSKPSSSTYIKIAKPMTN